MFSVDETMTLKGSVSARETARDASLSSLLTLVPTRAERARAAAEFYQAQALAFLLLGEEKPVHRGASGRTAWRPTKHRR